MPGVREVFPFENRGEEIGVTLHHPHGQIYAYPYVTPRTKNLLASIASYGPSLMGDILEFEAKSERVLIAGEHFTVFVPFAARWPLEVHMLPHRHVPDLAATTAAERDEIAVLYRRVLRGLDRLYDTPTPYIAAWHQAPVHAGRAEVRLMLQVTSPRRAADKLKFLAGSETAMGAFIGDVEPEAAAARAAGGPAWTRASGFTPDLRRFPRRRLVRARAGQPDRRAHRLQRRLRAAVRDRRADRRRRRAARRRHDPVASSPSRPGP